MFIRNTASHILTVLALALGSGCNQSASQQNHSEGTPQQQMQAGPIATVHWIGLKQLAADKSADGFMKIWRLPESERLKAQTLDKLALAPWRPTGTNASSPVTNVAALFRQTPSAALLRPLLDDLVQEEWYLEIRDTKDRQAQLALALRVDASHAGVWETNLGSVMDSTGNGGATRSQSANHGWEFQIEKNAPGKSALLHHVQFARGNAGWIVIGFAPGHNEVFTNLLARIQGSQNPFKGESKDWLNTSFQLQRLRSAMSWKFELPPDWPKISFSANGNGTDVLNHATFVFSKPLSFKIEPWNIPTNLIHEPVYSFTAIQGLKPWLDSLGWWKQLHTDSLPNQLFCWAQSGSPFLSYAAAPSQDATKVIAKLGPAIIDSMNPLLASNRMGKWERSTNVDGVHWMAPVVAPFVQSISTQEGNYLLGGLSAFGLTNGAPPVGTFHGLQQQTNAVYFDREISGPRAEAWLYITQIFRIIFRRAQLPPDSRSIAWLKAIAPMLGNSSTVVTMSRPNELTGTRSSTIGLTGPEMHLLADWLESPEFPYRPFSTVAKLKPPPVSGSAKMISVPSAQK